MYIPTYERKFGAVKSPIDIRDYTNKKVSRAQIFPDEFQLPMVRIKDQGSVGSCVAHSLSEVVEYFNSIQTKDSSEMSTGFIYGDRINSSYKGEGMIIRDALDNLIKYGDVKKDFFTENVEVPQAISLFEERYANLTPLAHPFAPTSYYRIDESDASQIKSALMNHGPVVFAIDWYNDLHFDIDNYTLRTDFIQPSGGHCMVIYGWNTDGWMVWNSWGYKFGRLGTCLYPYEYPISEAWGVIDVNDINDSDIKKPFKNLKCKKIFSLINKILTFLNRVFS